MKDHSIVTARGVYKDLNASPYIYKVCGVPYRFSSQTKLNVFTKKFVEAKIKLDRFIETYELYSWREIAYMNTANSIYKKMRRV